MGVSAGYLPVPGPSYPRVVIDHLRSIVWSIQMIAPWQLVYQWAPCGYDSSGFSQLCLPPRPDSCYSPGTNIGLLASQKNNLEVSDIASRLEGSLWATSLVMMLLYPSSLVISIHVSVHCRVQHAAWINHYSLAFCSEFWWATNNINSNRGAIKSTVFRGKGAPFKYPPFFSAINRSVDGQGLLFQGDRTRHVLRHYYVRELEVREIGPYLKVVVNHRSTEPPQIDNSQLKFLAHRKSCIIM